MQTESAEERATRHVSTNTNHDGEAFDLDGIELQHRFVSAPGAVGAIDWHFVDSGDDECEAAVLVHGHPFSWTYWKPLFGRIAPRLRVIAPDLKGYGQSGKAFGDWRPHRIAEELLALLDEIEVERFSLVAADRASAVCDHLTASHPDRVLRYVRLGAPNECELEGDSDYEAWHSEPLWAPDMLADTSRYFVGIVEPQLVKQVPDEIWAEALSQFAFEDIGKSVPRFFQESSFSKERVDRRDTLFQAMQCPVLDLRGGSTQRYVFAENCQAERADNWREETIADCGPYLMLDAPEVAAEAIACFLADAPAAIVADKASAASPEYVPNPSKLSSDALVSNSDGEIEMLGSVPVTHRFAELAGNGGTVRWHFVEAGQAAGETIVMLHGHPESWFAWRHQICHFANSYRIIAPDLKGYGQSEKRPADFRHEGVADELLGLINHLGIGRFNLVAHDRGAVQADYIGGKHPDRIIRYVRMQQLGHLFLPANSPQEKLFRDPEIAPRLFGNPQAIFDRMWARFKMKPISEEHRKRMISEVSHPGFADAVVRYFQASSFQKELHDRVTRLFPAMNFPVLVLQAGEDVGQPRWYFDDPQRPLSDLIGDLRVQFLEGAGHFTTVNEPELLTQHIARFMMEPATKEA